jgi:ribonucleoside-diphosphate reductase alpha chain
MDNSNYHQAPFEDITKEQFEEMERSLTAVDLRNVYEHDDETDHKAEAACAGGACQLI